MMAKNALINPAEWNTFPVKPVAWSRSRIMISRMKMSQETSRSFGVYHLADQKMLPKIPFVSKAELERREDQEKVSKLLCTTKRILT
jgi:hypothetical protein